MAAGKGASRATAARGGAGGPVGGERREGRGGERGDPKAKAASPGAVVKDPTAPTVSDVLSRSVELEKAIAAGSPVSVNGGGRGGAGKTASPTMSNGIGGGGGVDGEGRKGISGSAVGAAVAEAGASVNTGADGLFQRSSKNEEQVDKRKRASSGKTEAVRPGAERPHGKEGPSVGRGGGGGMASAVAPGRMTAYGTGSSYKPAPRSPGNASSSYKSAPRSPGNASSLCKSAPRSPGNGNHHPRGGGLVMETQGGAAAFAPSSAAAAGGVGGATTPPPIRTPPMHGMSFSGALDIMVRARRKKGAKCLMR